jgi:hypothetical protein
LDNINIKYVLVAFDDDAEEGRGTDIDEKSINGRLEAVFLIR